jgi:hypothetical protein
LIVHVLNVNDPPSITSGDMTIAYEDRYYEVQFEALDTDPTKDSMYWTMASNCSFLSIEHGSGKLFGIPRQDDIGLYWVNVSVSDGQGGSDSRNFTLTILGTNDPPVLTDPPEWMEIDEDTVFWMDPVDWFLDPDLDELNYTFAVKGNNMTLVRFVGPKVLIRPKENWSGIEGFIITAQDGDYSVSHELRIRVRPVNDPPTDPTITLESIAFIENRSQPAIGSAHDPDLEYGDVLNYTWRSNISGYIGSGSRVNLSLGPGFHNVSLNVVDSEGASVSTWVHITVQGWTEVDPGKEGPPEGTGPEWDDGEGDPDPGLITIAFFGAIMLLAVIGLFLFRKHASIENGMELEDE